MAATLSSYREQAEALGSDAYLGRLFWYSLSGVRVPHGEMIQMLATCGIVTGLPRVPEDVDVFKRVCRLVSKYNKIPTSIAEEFENYRLVEFRDDDYVTRRVVRERVDNKGRRLDFTEMMDIRFCRADSHISGENIAPELMVSSVDPDSIPLRLLDDISTGFTHWRGCLDLYGVRCWVRDRLQEMDATMVKSGLYFLAEQHADRVEAIEHFGQLINDSGYGTVDFHSLPLLDDGKQRDMVRRAFEAETSDAIDSMLKEIADLSAGDKLITSDRYAKIVTDYQSIVAKTKRYEGLLEDTLANTETRLKVFKKSLVGLSGKVKS